VHRSVMTVTDCVRVFTAARRLPSVMIFQSADEATKEMIVTKVVGFVASAFFSSLYISVIAPAMVLPSCASGFLVTHVEQPCWKSAPLADEITSATTHSSSQNRKGRKGRKWRKMVACSSTGVRRRYVPCVNDRDRRPEREKLPIDRIIAGWSNGRPWLTLLFRWLVSVLSLRVPSSTPRHQKKTKKNRRCEERMGRERNPRRKEDTRKNNSAKPWLQSRRVCPTIFLGMATIDRASSGSTAERDGGRAMGRANSQKPDKRLSLVDIPVLNWWLVRLPCLFSFWLFYSSLAYDSQCKTRLLI
jgi:hypothetical protein